MYFLLICLLAIMAIAEAKGKSFFRRNLNTLNENSVHTAHKKERLARPYEKKERIAYLVQGPSASAQIWKARIDAMGESATLLYHSFDKNCDICIFEKGTSFSYGRNLLLLHALQLSHRPKYFVFVDEDIQMDCNLPNTFEGGRTFDKQQKCWNNFTEELLNPVTTNILISPKTWKDVANEPTNFQTCIDDAIIAYRSDMVHISYPLPTHRESQSWWLKTSVTWAVIDTCLPYGHLSDSRWRVRNTLHRDYPKSGIFDPAAVRDVLFTEYPDIRNWTSFDPKSVERNRCRISPQRVDVLDRDCEAKLKSRFMNYYYAAHVTV